MNILLPLLPTARQLLQIVFIIFKTFGFTPFALHSYTLKIPSSPRADGWYASITGLQLVCFIGLHLFVMANRHMFYSGLQILNMNDIIKYGSQMLAILVVLLNVLLQRAVHRRVWVQLNVVREMALARFVNAFLRLYLWKFYGFAAFCAIVDGLVFCFAVEETEDKMYYLVMLVLRLFLRLRHLFHMFFIDLLKVHLQQLHYGLAEVKGYLCELQSTRSGRSAAQRRAVYSRSIERLLHLKAVYGQLWELNDGINRTFGWSQICNFTANFVDLSCDLYWCYLATISFGFESVREYMASVTPSAVLIVLLLNAAESCLREGSSIGTALLGIPIDNEPTLRRIVYRFGLQLSQQKIHLTANGLFDINYSLLRLIGTGIATYMVIFITFSKEIDPEQVEEVMEEDI